jgi:hypothetical protein
MKRSDIEGIKVGQTGLYSWDKSCPVVEVGTVREVLYGHSKGKAFRYVQVASSTGNATIGFIVHEDD